MWGGYLRERGSMEARIAADPEARHQHPRWWSEALRAAYPADWEGILAAGNTHPPLCLRVNRRREQVAAYHARLVASTIAARQVAGGAPPLQRGPPIVGL